MKKLCLSIFIFVMLTGCNACCQDIVKQDDCLGISPKFYSELSKVLNKDYIYKTSFAEDSLSQFKYFFVLKFFKIDANLYYSLWTQPFFPTMNKTNEGWVWTDTTNIYYYRINGNSLVIIDCPNSRGHGLYKQNTNQQAIEVMHRAQESYIPELGEIKTPCISYWIKGKDSIVKISPMLPIKYESERE